MREVMLLDPRSIGTRSRNVREKQTVDFEGICRTDLEAFLRKNELVVEAKWQKSSQKTWFGTRTPEADWLKLKVSVGNTGWVVHLDKHWYSLPPAEWSVQKKRSKCKALLTAQRRMRRTPDWCLFQSRHCKRRLSYCRGRWKWEYRRILSFILAPSSNRPNIHK